jgi:DsbC/DsbD-like thiol-disulfide interchange protein
VRSGVVLLSGTIVLSALGLGYDDTSVPSVKIRLDEPSNRHPVVAGAAVAQPKMNAGGTFILVVKARTAPNWHIYAADIPSGSSIPTTLKLKLPKGIAPKGEWTYPKPTQIPGTEGWIYEGDMTFHRVLKLSPDVAAGPIEIGCEFGYQACDPFSCRPPAKIDLQVKAEVLPAP